MICVFVTFFFAVRPPASFARIMQAQHTFRREIWFAYNTFLCDFSAHARCALFFPHKSAFAHIVQRHTPHIAKKKVRARINLHIQHPSAGNRHFLAHTCAFDTFIVACFSIKHSAEIGPNTRSTTALMDLYARWSHLGRFSVAHRSHRQAC
jgi:hypothetical protein